MVSLYNPNVPTGLLELDEDYINLQNNFQQLNTTFQVNHVPLTDNTVNNGAHTYVEMRNEAGLPAGLQNLEGTIYTRQANAVSEMFYTPDNSTDQYQLTRTLTTQTAKFSTNTNYSGALLGGWTFLPGGMLFQYGFLPNPLNDAIITFPVSFTLTAFSITLGPVRSNSNDKFIGVKDGSVTNAQFQIILSGTQLPTGLYWQAVGK